LELEDVGDGIRLIGNLGRDIGLELGVVFRRDVLAADAAQQPAVVERAGNLREIGEVLVWIDRRRVARGNAHERLLERAALLWLRGGLPAGSGRGLPGRGRAGCRGRLRPALLVAVPAAGRQAGTNAAAERDCTAALYPSPQTVGQPAMLSHLPFFLPSDSRTIPSRWPGAHGAPYARLYHANVKIHIANILTPKVCRLRNVCIR